MKNRLYLAFAICMIAFASFAQFEPHEGVPETVTYADCSSVPWADVNAPVVAQSTYTLASVPFLQVPAPEILPNGTPSTLLDKIRDQFDWVFSAVLILFGFAVKQWGDRVPLLKEIPTTALQVFAIAVMLAFAMILYDRGDVWLYFKSYTFATSLYELVIKNILALFRTRPIPSDLSQG
jgi:hypothetical protein